MAKLYKLKCPECNAPLDIDLKKPVKYCMYCGTPIFFDDGTKRIEINSRHERIIRDEAKIVEEQNRLAVEREKTKQKKEENSDMKWWAIVMIAFIILWIILLFLG